MADDGRRWISLQAPEELVETVDDVADAADMSRSAFARFALEHAVETQADDLIDAADLRSQERDQIERNQEVRELLPSKWRSHVRGLFNDNLRDDLDPADLRTMASMYREQAELKEQRAELIDEAPEADLVGIVDEELAHALEAADLSTWYEGVENPHERTLTGVEDGREDREALLTVLESALDRYHNVRAIYSDPSRAAAMDPADLPPKIETVLPDDVTREDVADAATQLAQAGVGPDDVRDVLLGNTAGLDVGSGVLDTDAIEADGGDPADDRDVLIQMGGRVQNPHPTDEHGNRLDDGDSEQQQQLGRLPTADGGRSPGAASAGFEEGMEDMNGHHDSTTDDSSTDSTTNADDQEAEADE